MPTFQFPIKGVNRTFSRSAQAVGTAYDMLNVLPFDGAGRLRGGQRPGTVKPFTTNLFGGVKLLSQNTTLTTAPTATFTDSFTYAAGSLQTVSTSVWTEYDSAIASGAGQLTVKADGTVKVVAVGDIGYGIRTATTTGRSYSIEIQCRINATTFVSQGGPSFALYARVDPTDPAYLFGVALNLTPTGMTLIGRLGPSGPDNFESYSPGGSIMTTGVWYTLKLVADGNTFTAYLNGVQRLQTTSDFNVTKTKIGFSANKASTIGSIGLEVLVDNFTYTDTDPRASYRNTALIAVGNGDIYVGSNLGIALASGGGSQLNAAVIPQVAFSHGKAYFVDGTSVLRQMDVATRTMQAWVSTAGAETSTTLGAYTLVAVYRDRLVLAASAASPQNFVLSRVGDQHDFNYGAGDTASAFAGNASTSGRIGEPIVALMVVSDDVMCIAGDHTLWAMRGDPADGGSIDLISDSIGLFGPRSWSRAPDGTIFFVGSGGFYKMAASGGQPEPLGFDKWNQFFADIDRTANYINLIWDQDKYGCYIYVSPVNGTAGTSLWYDARTEGLFPLQYSAEHGPLSVLLYDGDGPDDRVLLLGGTDGYVRQTSATALSDDGTAISSFVLIGPFQIGDSTNDGLIDGVDVTFGEPDSGLTTASWGVNVEVRTGRDAYSVTQATPVHRYVRDFGKLIGRVGSLRRRLRGAWGAVKVSNSTMDKTFSFESVNVSAIPGGKTRR